MKPSERVTGGTSGTINTHGSPPVLLGQNCQDLQQIKRLVLEKKKRMSNIYEDCIECEKCRHPFLPVDDEKICDECQEIDEEGERIQQEKTGAGTGPTKGSKNQLGENQD